MLYWSQAKELLDIFKLHTKTTGITKCHGFGKERIITNPSGSSCRIYPKYEIKFTEWGRGITWLISFIERKDGFKYGKIDATFNPRLLFGEDNYITASNEKYIDKIPRKYNSIIKEISDEIPLFSEYALTRVDYCVNFDLEELWLRIPTEKMMQLLKRANDWGQFKERLVYNKTSHRWLSEDNCFYLKTNRVNINNYWKYPQFLKDYPDTPSIEESKNVIRFEVQFKSPKICEHRKAWTCSTPEWQRTEFNFLKYMLSDKMSEYVVTDYFDKVIRPGNYYYSIPTKTLDIIFSI